MNSTTLPLPALAEADGVFFLTLTRSRETIATAIERLIDMLDDADDWDEREEENEHFCECLAHEGDGECDDEDNADDEPSLGWCRPSEGWQDIYGPWARHAGDDGISKLPREPRALIDCEGDEHDGREPDVDAEIQFWTEAVNQDDDAARCGEMCCMGEDMEPDLGFCIPGAGWTGGSGDDREGDDEREENGDEHDYSGSEEEGYTGTWSAGGVRIGKAWFALPAPSAASRR